MAAQDVALGKIPSTRLFQRYDVPNSGLTCSGTPCITKETSDETMHTTLQIMPGLTCLPTPETLNPKPEPLHRKA